MKTGSVLSPYQDGMSISSLPPYFGKYVVGVKVIFKLPSVDATKFSVLPAGGEIVDSGALNVDATGTSNAAKLSLLQPLGSHSIKA